MANIGRAQLNKDDGWTNITDLFESLVVSTDDKFTLSIEGQGRACIASAEPTEDSADGFRIGNTTFIYEPESGNDLYLIAYDSSCYINLAKN